MNKSCFKELNLFYINCLKTNINVNKSINIQTNKRISKVTLLYKYLVFSIKTFNENCAIKIAHSIRSNTV